MGLATASLTKLDKILDFTNSEASLLAEFIREHQFILDSVKSVLGPAHFPKLNVPDATHPTAPPVAHPPPTQQ